MGRSRGACVGMADGGFDTQGYARCNRMCNVSGVNVSFHGKACFFSFLGQIFNFSLAQVLSRRGESFKM